MSASSPAPTVPRPEVRAARIEFDIGSGLIRRLRTCLAPFGVAVIYLSFPTKNYYWDGISFAFAIENSSGFTRALIHPHHLLYNVFGFVLYRLAHAIGWPARAIDVLQFSNILLSIGCALLLYRFLNHTLKSRLVATILVAAFSFSATWWKYSTDADSYVPSMLFLIICLNLLLAADKVRPIPLAVAHLLSMCFHQLAVFFFPVIVTGILLRKEHSFRIRLRQAFIYASTATLSTLALNYYCFYLATGSFGLSAFGRWLTSYLQGPESYSFSFSLLRNLRYTLRAQVRLLFEGRFNWLEGGASLPNLLLVGTLVGLCLLLVVRVVRFLPRLTVLRHLSIRIDPRFRILALVSLVWLAVYTIFLFFWYPYFTPYRMFCVPALIVMVGVFLVHRQPEVTRTRGLSLAFFVAAMAISNFLFFIFPLSHSDKYPPLQFALKLNESWSAETVVYYRQPNADNQLVRYFNPSTTWRTLNAANASAPEDELNSAYQSGRNVWLETSAILQLESTSAGQVWLSQHARADCRKELSSDSYFMKYVQVFPRAAVARIGSDCSLPAYVQENSFQ